MDLKGSRSALLRAGGGRDGNAGNSNLGVVSQLLKAAVGQDIARFNSLYCRRAGVLYARLDILQVGRIVLYDVDKGRGAIVLYGRGGNQGCVLKRIHQQPG